MYFNTMLSKMNVLNKNEIYIIIKNNHSVQIYYAKLLKIFINFLLIINILCYFIQANPKIRLHGGRDHIWIPLYLDSNTTNVASFNQKIPEKIYPFKGTENLEKIKKLKSNKNDQPGEINIRNIKKIKYLPTNFQKLMIPKNNTKLNCHFIKKNADSSSILNTRTNTNIKNILDDSQKKAVQSKFMQVLREEKYTLDETKFENISRVSILLLYLHFLLCYYLSFSKTNHFNEFFGTCLVKDTEN